MMLSEALRQFCTGLVAEMDRLDFNSADYGVYLYVFYLLKKSGKVVGDDDRVMVEAAIASIDRKILTIQSAVKENRKLLTNIEQNEMDHEASEFIQIQMQIDLCNSLVKLFTGLRAGLEQVGSYPSWTAQYALTDGEITNDAVVELKHAMQKERKQNAYKEFIKREVRINGQNGLDREHVDELLNQLVDTLPGAGEKAELLAWLKRYGGGDWAVGPIVQALVVNKHIITADKAEFYAANGVDNKYANWCVEQGKIHCRYQSNVSSIMHMSAAEDPMFVLLGADGRGQQTNKPPFSQITKPVLRVNVDIELNLENGKVLPKIKILDVEGYTHVLRMNADKGLKLKKPPPESHPPAPSLARRSLHK